MDSPVTNSLNSTATGSGKFSMDSLFRLLTRIAAGLSFFMVIAILVSLTYGAAPALHKFGLGFLFSTAWDPVKEVFGAAPAVLGTLITSFIALLFAVPLSFGIALYI
ncbi:MAG: phosphate ABC transporter permease subunit PstC, partial [Gammaproteobacteria bacterium]